MEMYESVRVREVGLRFGMEGRGAGARRAEVARMAEARAAEVRLPRCGIVLITGASGSGKTTLVRALERRLRGCGGGRCVATPLNGRSGDLRTVACRSGDLRTRAGVVRLEGIGIAARAVVDCFSLGLEETLGLLSRAGLAEPRVWCTGARELSEGEKFRLRLALWMASGRRVLIADEFCNALDRVTARGVAWQLRKFVDQGIESLRDRVIGSLEGPLAIVATGHEDLAEDLRAEVRVRL